MKKNLQILFTTLLFFAFQSLYAQTIFLVNPANKEITIPVGISAVAASDWNNACGDLQAAIDAAGALSFGGQVWVMKGTYTPELNESFQMKSSIKVYGHFSGIETALVQRNLNDKASETILKGNGKSTLRAENITQCYIDGLTITGGVGSPFNVVGTAGGGVFISEADIWLSHCFISDNMASETGGGLLIHNSFVTISNCIIQNNTTTSSRGGGIYNYQYARTFITDSDFVNNLGNSGGAVCNDFLSSVTLTRCKFKDNQARNSGGALLSSRDAKAILDNCIFTDNSALSSAGGALFFTNSTGTLNNCVISSNHSLSEGGGIYVANNTLDLNGCVIENNSSETGTGGASGQLNLTNCLISNNRTAHGTYAGILSLGFLKNSIVWGNYSADNSGLTVPQINSSATISNSIIEGGYSGSGNVDADPLFVNAANPAGIDNIFGTVDDGFHLRACSPGIDAGIYEMGLSSVDLSGATRFYNKIIDIGPYEYQGDKAEQMLASDYESAAQNVFKGQKTVYMAEGLDCKLIAAIESTGSQPITGSILSKVWTDAVQSGQFVKRHYEITPVDNALSATARVTLYATDAEFSAYNKVGLSSSVLPLSTDEEAVKAARISNVKIEKYSGVSSDGTGQPQSYGGSRMIIDPADKDVVWNTADQRWEITFDVTGFSGFFIRTLPVPLPVHWVSVTASFNVESQPVINWTVQENAVASYHVQRSVDARSFETIGKVEGLGDGMHTYRFTDSDYLPGVTYYRIIQWDLDGTSTLSRIVTLNDPSKINSSFVFPVPAKNEVFFQIKDQTDPLFQIAIIDVNGKELKRQAVTNGNNKLDISKLPEGIYLIRTSGGEVFKIVKE